MKNFLRLGAYSKKSRAVVQLHIGKKLHEFDTPAGFEAFLSDYETIPELRIRQFSTLDRQALNQQLITTQRAWRGCKDLLMLATQQKSSLQAIWHMLEPSPEPEDYDWSSILFELDKLPASEDVFRRIALECYLQYLAQRSRVLASAMWQGEASVAGSRAREENTATVSGSAYRSHAPALTGMRQPHFQRLPRRQSITMSLRNKPDIELLLAEHSVKILLDSGVATLMDKNGARYVLHSGRNLVGRAGDCDICIPTGRNDISRRHAVIELLPEFQVRITDISSRGTYLHS